MEFHRTVMKGWGNLQKTPASPAGENFQFAADANNHLTNQTYDAAGNVINDGAGNSFVFDSENRITAATANSATTTYTYDADGRRVKKSSGPNYWYGPGGEALAETDVNGNFTYYIFFGGQRLARNIPQPSPNPPDIKYYLTDHLHSTAMFVDQGGSVLDDNDFYPWGGIVPGVGQTNSTNTVKFTGKYRDNETQLDYFGARYYANTSGRWMSPDWAAKPTTVPYADFGDPQSLNLYAYVRNSPIVRVDADGHNFAGMNGFMADPTGGIGPENEELVQDDEGEASSAGNLGLPQSYSFTITPAMLADRSQDANGVCWIPGLSPRDILATLAQEREMKWQSKVGDAADLSGGQLGAIAGGKALSAVLSNIFGKLFGGLVAGTAAKAGASLTYEEVGGAALRLTERMSASGSRRLTSQIAKEGLKDASIKYTEIGGERYVVNGNNRLLAARQLGITGQLSFEKVSLPFAGFKTEADVIFAHAEFISGVRY